MNEEQKAIALQAISAVIQDASCRANPPNAEDVTKLAVDTAKAMSAAFAELK